MAEVGRSEHCKRGLVGVEPPCPSLLFNLLTLRGRR